MQEVEITTEQLMAMVESGQVILEELLDEEETTSDSVSVWIKDKDVFLPSTDVSILKELPPGMYKAGYSNDRGIYCQKIELETDELFSFTESLHTELLEQINTFWDNAELYKEKNLIHKRGILLAGYAGTGKTAIINMVSRELIERGGVVFKVYGIRGLSDYVDFIKHGFRKIQPNTPIITILEDIDQYREVETELLDFLDGQYHINHHVIIATSNNTSEIPDTFLRPSRLDLKYEVGLPTELTRKEYFNRKGVDENMLDELVKATESCSIAELKEVYICITVYGYSIEKAVDQVLDPTVKKNYLENPRRKSKIGIG